MPRILSMLSLSVLGLCTSLSGQAFGDEPLDLKAMTYNIRYGSANDGDNHWKERRETLVRSIQEYDPDIIGTQETLEFQAEYIAEELPEYRWLGIGRDVNGQGEMTAILYKWRHLVPVEMKTFWLSETPDVPGSKSWDASLHRIVTWVKFHHWKSGTFFHCYNTHFDHRGEMSRTESAKLLAAYIQEQHGDDYPVIVLGDFNATAEASDAYSAFLDAGFQDAWKTATETVGPPVTWGAFRAPVRDTSRRIDWILHRGNVATTKCETIVYNEEGRYPSDHYPVQAWLEIGAQADAQE